MVRVRWMRERWVVLTKPVYSMGKSVGGWMLSSKSRHCARHLLFPMYWSFQGLSLGFYSKIGDWEGGVMSKR